MKRAEIRRFDAAWPRWYRRALPAYWIFLFLCTHFPKLRLDLRVPQSDKWIHFIAFGLLAFLFWRCVETNSRELSPRFVWIAAVVLLSYAALDEWLQQFVNRSTDLADWLCDAGGILIVLVVMEIRRRRSVRPAPVQQ